MFISKRKLEELEDRLCKLEDSTGVYELDSDYGEPYTVFWLPPWKGDRKKPVPLNRIVRKILEHLGLELEPSTTTVVESKLVKKKKR